MDWNDVFQKEIPPPWVPEIDGKTDFQYFDDYPDSNDPLVLPKKGEQSIFENF